MFTNKQLKINTQVKRVFIHLKAERHCSRLTSTAMPFLKYMDGFSAIPKITHLVREPYNFTSGTTCPSRRLIMRWA